MRKLFALTVLAATLIAPRSASAAPPSLGSLITSGTNTSLGNGGFIGSATSNPVFTGPFRIFCTDQNNGISLGSTYSVWITPLWNNNDMSKTRLANNPFALNVYKANASLASLIATPIDNADRARQVEMWRNADGNVNSAPTFGNANFNAIGWYIFTAVGAAGLDDDNRMQEQLGFSAVPEPSTYALFASGLLGVGTITRRRRKQQH